MSKRDEILSTEYDFTFDEKRKDAMTLSYHKYGSVEENAKNGTTNFIKSLEMRMDKFKQTKNTEYLIDVANFCMMIYMYPQYFGCHYKPTESNESPGVDGMSVQELKDWK